MPRVAGLLFFRVTCWGFLISTLRLHLKQYACTSRYLLFSLITLLLYTACQYLLLIYLPKSGLAIERPFPVAIAFFLGQSGAHLRSIHLGYRHGNNSMPRVEEAAQGNQGDVLSL